jgi:glyoxylase-like metal-dependent hydrolase (beta-lactamase superfamily II)
MKRAALVFALLFSTGAALAEPLPRQHRAIAEVAPDVEIGGAWTRPRIISFASPAPDAINIHIVETRNGVILFDALRRADQVAEAQRLLDRIGKPVVAIFVTHAHTDHYGGVPFLRARYPAVPVYATQGVSDFIARDPAGAHVRRRADFGERFASQEQFNANLPDHIVTEGQTITIDGVRIIVHHLGLSESDDAAVYALPHFDALVTGDLVNSQTASAPVNNIDNWFGQLDRLDLLAGPRTTALVGHGQAGRAASLIAENRAYLIQLRAGVSAALRGDNIVTADERQAIVDDLRIAFPHYGGAAALPPDALMAQSVRWAAAQLGGSAID